MGAVTQGEGGLVTEGEMTQGEGGLATEGEMTQGEGGLATEGEMGAVTQGAGLAEERTDSASTCK